MPSIVPASCCNGLSFPPAPAGWLALAFAAMLAGCAAPTAPRVAAAVARSPHTAPSATSAPSAADDRDGAEARPPSDLALVPDAEPKLEPIRSGGPNKPYQALGRDYVPLAADRPFSERGLASWYGKKFHGRRTASGETYNMYAMTAAHPTLPIPSYVRVRNPANGREALVRINDRGPFHAGRIIDLSYTAALKLDVLRGVALVELERITFDDIRSGAWRRDAVPTDVLAQPREADPAIATEAAASAPTPAQLASATDRVGVLSGFAPAGRDSARSGPAAADSIVPTSVSGAIEPVSTFDRSLARGGGTEARVGDGAAARAFTGPARGFWVQVGAFRERAGAEGFQLRIGAEAAWLAPLLAVFSESAIYRLQAGPYPSRDEAARAAERVRDEMRLVPLIVERR